MEKPSFLIYVVEDNSWYNKLLKHCLELNLNYTVESFSTARDMLNRIDKNPDLITIDYRLPDMTGDELLLKIKQYNEHIEVLVISEQENVAVATNLLRKGAFDYLVKEKEIKDKLLNAVKHVYLNNDLKGEISRLKDEVNQKYNFSRIVGASKVMNSVYSLIEKSLNTNINVSISGDTGTGKEVTAKCIHHNSKYKEGPFVAVNMSAIPKELLESELFGHEKGAFTGAESRRIGKFESAKNGTLFLDEISELDLEHQAKILRVIQEREVVRVGSNSPISINCRIITATNKNLSELVKSGDFREDLFYRLKGIPIALPPLNRRGSDILLLASNFIEKFCAENSIDLKILNKEAKQKLLKYSWPGNIRELKSVVELGIVMSNNSEITAEDIILDELAKSELDNDTSEMTLREYNRLLVKRYLEKYNNDSKKVADILNIGQTTVYRLMKELKSNS